MSRFNQAVSGFLLILLACCAESPPPRPDPQLEAELMCLVLQRVGPIYCGQSEIVDDAEAEILLVTEVGGSNIWSRNAEEDLSGLRVGKDTVASWRHQNTVEPPRSISDFLTAEVPGPDMTVAPKIDTISYGSLVALFKGAGGWERFRERYPRVTHYVILSAVGVSNDGDEALVLTSRSYGPLGGEGDAYVLARRDGRWRIRWAEGLWMS